jgi:hypothetical protein
MLAEDRKRAGWSVGACGIDPGHGSSSCRTTPRPAARPTHDEWSVPREGALGFLEALAGTVTPEREETVSEAYDEALKRTVVVELYDENRVLIARATIR